MLSLSLFLFAFIKLLFLESSIHVTFLDFSDNIVVNAPHPAPISKTESSLVIGTHSITCDLISDK